MKTLFHATPLANLASIKKYGLISLHENDGVYFTDSDTDSISWVSEYEKRKGKSGRTFGLCIVEFDENDPLLFNNFTGTSCVYAENPGFVYLGGDIHPSRITFEEVFIGPDGDMSFYESENKVVPAEITRRTKVELFKKATINTMSWNSHSYSKKELKEAKRASIQQWSMAYDILVSKMTGQRQRFLSMIDKYKKFREGFSDEALRYLIRLSKEDRCIMPDKISHFSSSDRDNFMAMYDYQEAFLHGIEDTEILRAA